MKFDVITFGAATYDTYLTSPEFKIRRTDEGVMLCEMYGRKIEIDDRVTTTGGGATNAAVCFERLGLESAVIGCVGKGYWGQLVKTELHKEGVSLLYLQTTAKKPTSSSVALIGKDGGRTVLVHRAASNLLSWRKVDWDRLNGQWVYVSSLGGDLTLLTKIVRFVKEKKIKLALNPGNGELSQAAKLKPLLAHVEVLILNKQEALGFLKKLGKAEDPEELSRLEVPIIVMTDGRHGATLFSKTEGKHFQPAQEVKPVEETGAGDAFGSTLVAGFIKGLSLKASLELASLNAASVVQAIGPKAGLLFWPEVKHQLSSK